MFNAEVRSMLFEVITSWQVVAVTILVILYFFLVGYVAKLDRPQRPKKAASPAKKKEKAPEEAVITEGDDLGLEETV